MKFGVREICDVVLRAKAVQKIGNKVFYKDEPVLYFDSLKTSSLEGAATTVYAQGGRGNSRLIAWEGERTVTFTMEDALISPAGFSILSGAGLTDAKETALNVHTTERVVIKPEADPTDEVTFYVSKKPCDNSCKNVYVMRVYNDEVVSEPYLPFSVATTAEASGDNKGKFAIVVKSTTGSAYKEAGVENPNFANDFKRDGDQIVALIDYYTLVNSGAQ